MILFSQWNGTQHLHEIISLIDAMQLHIFHIFSISIGNAYRNIIHNDAIQFTYNQCMQAIQKAFRNGSFFHR